MTSLTLCVGGPGGGAGGTVAIGTVWCFAGSQAGEVTGTQAASPARSALRHSSSTVLCTACQAGEGPWRCAESLTAESVSKLVRNARMRSLHEAEAEAEAWAMWEPSAP
jgi:hypothetical protein